jgi:UDP-glucose 4-epimerase
MAGVELVFHEAAIPSVVRSVENPPSSMLANVQGTTVVLDCARHAKVRRLVYAASSSAYGDTPTLPKIETMEPLPRSPYAASKLSGEQYVLAYARAGLVEGVALRYFNVFGPRQSPTGPYAAVIMIGNVERAGLFTDIIRNGYKLSGLKDVLSTRYFLSYEPELRSLKYRGLV